ncbi:MAG: PQQ-dependent sugar dehydrogenase, partial [Chloroflexota bacterium]
MGRMTWLSAVLLTAILAGTASVTTRAAADVDGLEIGLVPVSDGFDQPVFVTAAAGDPDRLYVVEQPGRIRVIGPDGATASAPFLDLGAAVQTGGERGLLGLAFHPRYADNGRFYVNYTRAPDGATVVSEFSTAAGLADRASERELLVIEQPFPNHNGGMIAFDAAGMLLVGTGDGGAGGDP